MATTLVSQEVQASGTTIVVVVDRPGLPWETIAPIVAANYTITASGGAV